MNAPALVLPTHDDGTGEIRKLGHIPPPEGRKLFIPGPPLLQIDEKDWVEFEYDTSNVDIKNQGNRGACNGHAAATSLEWARWLAGMSRESLSAWYVYAILCNGVDSGSNIGDALTLLSKQGTCLDSSVPYSTINPRALSAASKVEAGRFKLEIGSALASFNDMMMATQAGRPGNYSIRVGNSFNNLDSEGVPGYSSGYGNHAVTFGIGARKMKNGQWKIKWQNSWGSSWGQGGYAWVTARAIDGQPGFEAYCVEAPQDDPSDPLNPPAIA